MVPQTTPHDFFTSEKIALASYPEESPDRGFIILLEKNPTTTRRENIAYTKHRGFIEGSGRSIKEAMIDFLTRNATSIVSITEKTVSD